MSAEVKKEEGRRRRGGGEIEVMADLNRTVSSARKQKYLLLETDSYSAALSPLKSTQRIKYTCFDVSESFLIFGATSGGLYVFSREPCSFLQLLPNKEGAVLQVSISPDEKLIAFASVRGVVCVLSRSESGGCATRCLNRSVEHNGSEVTALCWVATSDQLFVGDKQGRLSVINVPLFMSKNIFNVPAFVFMQLDSGVVQVCSHGERLLVSTLTRCYVCDTEKEQYRQVGSKLREGEFGACYFGEDQVKIFCARPGSRLWEVDSDGVVQSTHQFKQALAQEPVVLVQNTEDCTNISYCESNGSQWPDQSFNFAKLSVVLNKYLFTFKQDGIYIFDPEKVDVILWSNHFKDIVDAKCVNDTIYIWTSSGEIHAVVITLIEQCLLRIYFRKQYKLCSNLCLRLAPVILESTDVMSKLGPILGLKECFDECDSELLNFLKKIEVFTVEKENSTRLDCGIFLVENHHMYTKQIEENEETLRCQNQKVLKVKNIRSQSLPPGNQNQRPKSNYESSVKINVMSASTNSLPELIQSSENKDISCELQFFHDNLNRITAKDIYLHYSLHPVPLLPVSSPDIIHDALLEIGINMSGKFANSTKTLRDKWQVLEGKLKLSKADNYEPLDVRKSDDVIAQEQNEEVQCDEEMIVNNQNSSKNKAQSNLPNVNMTELTNLCNELEKKNVEKRPDLISEVISNVLLAHSQYIQILVSKSSTINVNSFPFSQYLSNKNILVLQNVFHDSFKTGAILNWLNEKSLIKEFNLKHYPDCLQRVYSEESLQLDFTLSGVLTVFSEILDPHMILQCLDRISIPCIFLSWCVIMDSFQEGAFRYITKNTGSVWVGCADWPLPLLLNAIFLSFRLEQVDPSFRMSLEGCVSFRNISYVLLKLAFHLEGSGLTRQEAMQKCDILLLGFVAKMINKHLEIDLQDKGVQSHLESAFININLKSDYGVCHCAFPIPGYGLFNAKHNEIGKRLITLYWDLYSQQVLPNSVKPDLLLSHDAKSSECYKNDPCCKGDEILLKFFQENTTKSEDTNAQNQTNLSKLESDYLKNIMRICCVSSSLLIWALQKAPNCGQNLSLALIVQLGLLSEIESYADSKSSVDWWENVLKMNGQVKRGQCCACGYQWKENRNAGFQWSQIATTILKNFGPTVTLNLLKKFASEILPGELDCRFYQSCVLTSMVDSHTPGLRGKVLDVINKVADGGENKAPMSPEIGETFCSALESDLCTVSPNSLSSAINHHWGITVDLKNGDCALCSLNLGAPRLLKDGGLRVFMCAHAFHNVCLRVAHSLLYCPLCSR